MRDDKALVWGGLLGFLVLLLTSNQGEAASEGQSLPVPVAPLPPPSTARVTGQVFMQKMMAFVQSPAIPWSRTPAPPRSFDCSSLGWYTARLLGLVIPRTASGQMRAGVLITEQEAIRTPGSLIVFTRNSDQAIKHVEYSTGGGGSIRSFISYGVGVSPWSWWNNSYNRGKYTVSFYRLPNIA